ncbi:MAG TPA: creatininase family protein [Dongiaceae bacterium]
MTGPLRGAFLEDLTWLEAKAWFDRDPVIVLGIGAIAKEHGHHLPLNTDFRIARALLEGVGRALPVLLAPILSFGYYPAFRHYPGSQHLEAETFIAVLRELLGGFIGQGARRLAIVNTGVSTEGPIRIAVRDLLQAHGIRVAVADIATLGRKADPLFQQKLGGHADEHETSLMLAIAPDSVRQDLARPNYGNALGSPKTVFYQPTIFSGEPTSGLDYSEQGARGDPTLATAEKGRQALDAMIDDLVSGLVALHPDLG